MINFCNPSQCEMIIINDYIMVNIAITIGHYQHSLQSDYHNILSVCHSSLHAMQCSVSRIVPPKKALGWQLPLCFYCLLTQFILTSLIFRDSYVSWLPAFPHIISHQPGHFLFSTSHKLEMYFLQLQGMRFTGWPHFTFLSFVKALNMYWQS